MGAPLRDDRADYIYRRAARLGKHFTACRRGHGGTILQSMGSGAFLATVGRRVRATREERGWSRRELSERSGVSERFLAQLETGRGNISLVRFAEVAAALGTTPAELLS